MLHDLTAAGIQDREVAMCDITVPPDRMRALRPLAVQEIAASMAEIGQLQPIVVRPHGATGYHLVAGRHRLEAAKKLEWDTIRASVADGMDADHALLAEIDENLIRGDLSPAERADHIGRRKVIYERLHPEAKHGGAPGKAGGGKVAKELKSGSFAVETAKAAQRSVASVKADATRAKNIPEIAKIVGTSLDKGEELDALAKLSPQRRVVLTERAAAGDKVSARPVLKQEMRAKREAELAEATARASKTLGTQLYSVILADPPWRFEPYSRETGMDRAADNYYPTMTLDELSRLKVPAAKDCALFLWATAPMLPQAEAVMKSLGFIYRSHCVWVKDRIGTGYWWRNQHEVLLLGIRGNVPAPAPGQQWPSVIHAPVGKHSAKPVVFIEMIDAMFPSSERLEMFARRGGPARPGWRQWGNEA